MVFEILFYIASLLLVFLMGWEARSRRFLRPPEWAEERALMLAVRFINAHRQDAEHNLQFERTLNVSSREKAILQRAIDLCPNVREQMGPRGSHPRPPNSPGPKNREKKKISGHLKLIK